MLSLILMIHNTVISAQYTTITGTWTDDFSIAPAVTPTFGWSYTDSHSINSNDPFTSGNVDYHGPYIGKSPGGTSYIFTIERQFRCSQGSSVAVTFNAYGCDTGAADYARIILDGTLYSTSGSGGNTYTDSTLQSATPDCAVSYRQLGPLGPYTISSVAANQLFTVRFQSKVTNFDEAMAISSIEITCNAFSTSDPTLPPSKNPTKSPLLNPSFSPTFNPTIIPSNVPTTTPTTVPTITPIYNPTISPTNNPSNNPTASPTNNPTVFPTNIPTISPVNNPIKSPTNSPVFVPTAMPSFTSSPIKSPTNAPTILPVNNPTKIPTYNPTNNPVLSAANIPTKTPTYNPVYNGRLPSIYNPSKSPTNVPTTSPMNNLEILPTNTPTISPVNNPTISPTNNHSNNPTVSVNIPVVVLTNVPTMTPIEKLLSTMFTSETSSNNNENLESAVNHLELNGKISLIVILTVVICFTCIILVVIKWKRSKKDKSKTDVSQQESVFNMTRNRIATFSKPSQLAETQTRERVDTNSIGQSSDMKSNLYLPPSQPGSLPLSTIIASKPSSEESFEVIDEDEIETPMGQHKYGAEFKRNKTDSAVYVMEGINDKALPNRDLIDGKQ